MSRTHLFVALQSHTWGEVVLALDIVAQLAARGDRVLFLAPSAMEVLFEGQPCTYGRFDDHRMLAPTLSKVLRAEKCDSLFLIEVSIFYRVLAALGHDADFLSGVGVPVIGLDVFDIGHTDLIWDMGETFVPPLSSHALTVEHRLIPCPTARPGGAGVYDSLPRLELAAGARAAARARLGLGDDERLVFMPTASWQQPTPGMLPPYNVRLGAAFAPYIARLLERLGERVRVLHLGRAPLAEAAAALGPRYQFRPRSSRPEFVDLAAASDLLLSFNPTATTIGLAAVLGLPVLAGMSSYGGATPEETAATLPFEATPAALAFVRAMGRLYPFRLWPLGFYRYLAPLFGDDNPYLSILHLSEVLDEETFTARGRALLFDDDARLEARAAAAAYVERVRRLPRAVEVIDGYLGT